MDLEVVGRTAELASVRAFVARSDEGPGALVLEGEAGIGKSTLWSAGVEEARARGIVVLSARPAEAERGLAHAGLGDLLEGVLGTVLPELSEPRRRSLEVALLLDESSGGFDHRALAVAVRDTLQLVAQRTPLVLAIDDVQWLDASSSDALAFALRRLSDSSVRVLLTRRVNGDDGVSALERAVAAEHLERLHVGALSVGALHRLLFDRLGRPLPRQTLLRTHERSGGNPFFALELARALDTDVDPLEPLPVPKTLDELVRARLGNLTAETRDVLALASAIGSPSEELLVRAGVATHALEPAFAARVLERDHDAIRFTHPLLASAVYPTAGRARRELHRRIASVIDDEVSRARHLALSADEPDPAVARIVDRAGRRAADRAAFAVAAELAEHALRLTPIDDDDRHGRALAAARAHRAAGEWTRVRAILDELLGGDCPRSLRAEALVVLSEVEGLERATTLLEQALDEAADRPAIQAAIQCRLAWTTRFKEGFREALRHARAGLQLADELDDDALRVEALGMIAFLGGATGDPQARAHATRAYEIATASRDARLVRRAQLALSGVTDEEPARLLLQAVYEESRDRDELLAAEALNGLAMVELESQRWELAADYAGRAYELVTQYGLEAPWTHIPTAVVAAHRGELETARGHSERALQLGEEQFGLHTPVHLGTLGFVAAQSGDRQAAVRWFAESEAVTTRLGWHSAAHRWWAPDHVEVLLELGEADDAERVLAAWESECAADDERTRASATRCRGLLAAARADVTTAATLLEEAVARHEVVGDTFGRGRALLALGVVRRRDRQKRAAREAIEAALADFQLVGATVWAERAHRELGRIGGRTRSAGLTAAERRVAALVAEGRTNKEVAAALFLGERTVETHLSHVYAKLGVRSRAELARSFRADDQSSGGLAISS